MIINDQKHQSRHHIELKPGDKIFICRCWKSEKFPYCDGSHRGHCERAGDDVGPATITVLEQKQ